MTALAGIGPGSDLSLPFLFANITRIENRNDNPSKDLTNNERTEPD